MSEKSTHIHIEEDSNSIWVKEFNTDAVFTFDEQVNQKFKENPRRPILININSPGGEVDGLFSMMDIMDSIRSQADENFFYFITHAVGKAYSAAAVLLSHGTVRFASPRARIMFHQVNGGIWGPKPDLDIEYKEICKINEDLLKAVQENCKYKKSLQELEALLARDTYFSAKQAQEFGIIDVVGSPKLLEHRVYELGVTNPGPEKPEPKKKRKKK